MEEAPKVSVIIPVYNTEQYLRQCLDSVVNQTLREIEIICVDDGSTDKSLFILQEYARSDERVHIISQKNQGPGAARNIGLDRALGKYLIFLDSDDWFEKDFLENMVWQAKETNADVVICCSNEFDTHSGRTYDGSWMLKTQLLPGMVFSPEKVFKTLFQFTYGWPWDKLYLRDYILKEKFRYPDLAVSQDLVFVYPSIFCAKNIAVLEQVLVHHRINRRTSVSNSRSRAPEASYYALKMVQKCLKERDLMEIYSQSFLNWTMEFLIWHVCNIGERKIQKQYYHILQSEWLPEFDFDKYPKDYFINRAVYAKYQLTKHVPYPIFRTILKLYRVWDRCKKIIIHRKVAY